MDLAPTLIMASLMAAPGALVISKIVLPETEESETMGKVKLDVKSNYVNVIDAISHGAGDGFKIAMNVIAMLIGFIAVIATLILPVCSTSWPAPCPRTSADGEKTRKNSQLKE